MNLPTIDDDNSTDENDGDYIQRTNPRDTGLEYDDDIDDEELLDLQDDKIPEK